jgi:hypothetical protein
LLILTQPVQNLEQKTIFFILCVKIPFKKFCHFSGTFLAMAITAATDNFLANCFHILKGLTIYYQMCK